MNTIPTNETDESVDTVQLVAKASGDKMDGSMTQHSDINPASDPMNETAPPKMNITLAAPIEEDESSLSSSNTDPFDRISANSSSRGMNWKVGADGNLHRYGATESATSTGVSSICSSVAADDKPIEPTVSLTPPKKRMADGTVKLSGLRHSTRNASISQPANGGAELSSVSPVQTQSPPKKRRGRPPKDRSLIDTPENTPKVQRSSAISKLQGEVRPRSSIPSRLPVEVFANQCIEAAHASRLDPYALHPSEHKMLVNLLMNKEVTVYLNIRNAMVRLWHQNPLCAITPEEAAGCAKDGRFFGLAEVAYKWLVRNGYINFGCVEVPRSGTKVPNKAKKQKTVVVIGAGVSGLTTARQLEHLFAQGAEKWTDAGEHPPRVVVLEGRNRIGGRVYSKPLRSQVVDSLPDDLRNTAEMGAMIITGFEHGNPLDTIIRGQLGLRYHLMHDALTIYDCNGRAVNEKRDMMNTELYTDVSDRAGYYRALPQHQETLRGDEDLVKRCRDPAASGFEDYKLEPLFDPLSNAKKSSFKRGRRRNAPPGTEKLTGRSQVIEESGTTTESAARAAKNMGWQLRDGVGRNQSVSLNKIANATKYPTLGSVMDGAIKQFQFLVQITPQDMRLLNWHHANLEYANAAPVCSLSLSGHDQDTGNEFEGKHSEIIGGYTQLPRGLMNLPTKLDVRFEQNVESIHYDNGKDSDNIGSTKIVCTNGEVIEADQIVMTTPLGVLKSDAIDFDPPLPGWKEGAIKRMGFGLLNKVILLYDAPFWDDDRDMFGLLNNPDSYNSLDPNDYAQNRGRFFLIWNASKTSGRPMLVALMAGKAAFDVEQTDTPTLLEEVNSRLRSVFTSKPVPAPLEVIVTRWKRDPFTRGTYSYVGPETRPSDYDLMAKPTGNLHFAGEATCGTHPATVHGAFLSGLRVAGEVMEAMAGPLVLPQPLVGPLTVKHEKTPAYMPPTKKRAFTLPKIPADQRSTDSTIVVAPRKSVIKQEPESKSVPTTPYTLAPSRPRNSVCTTDESFWAQPKFESTSFSYEASIVGQIFSELGERPLKPTRPGVNPFLIYTKEKWDECKVFCSTETTAAGRDAIRRTLGVWWRAASDETKQPYLAQSQAAQEQADAARKEWEQNVQVWDVNAARIRHEYVRDHPVPNSADRDQSSMGLMEGSASRRKTNVSGAIALEHV